MYKSNSIQIPKPMREVAQAMRDCVAADAGVIAFLTQLQESIVSQKVKKKTSYSIPHYGWQVITKQEGMFELRIYKSEPLSYLQSQESIPLHKAKMGKERSVCLFCKAHLPHRMLFYIIAAIWNEYCQDSPRHLKIYKLTLSSDKSSCSFLIKGNVC